MKGIPQNTIKEILKTNVKEDLCKESIVYVKEFIDDVLIKISKALEIEHKITNQERRDLKLPELKRIDKLILKRVLENQFKSTSNFKDGDRGQYNIETLFSKASIEVVWNELWKPHSQI